MAVKGIKRRLISDKQKAINKAYSKERDRIRKQINRMQKADFEVPEGALPKIPKKKTAASVRKLKAITTEKLYKQSRYIDYITGEIFPGLEGKKIRSEAAKEARKRKSKRKHPEMLPDEANIVINNVLSQLRMEKAYKKHYNRRAYLRAARQSIKDSAIQLIEEISNSGTRDKAALAKRLQENAARVQQLIDYVMYSSRQEEIQTAGVELMSIVQGRALTIDELYDISDGSEYDEDFELPE